MSINITVFRVLLRQAEYTAIINHKKTFEYHFVTIHNLICQLQSLQIKYFYVHPLQNLHQCVRRLSPTWRPVPKCIYVYSFQRTMSNFTRKKNSFICPPPLKDNMCFRSQVLTILPNFKTLLFVKIWPPPFSECSNFEFKVVFSFYIDQSTTCSSAWYNVTITPCTLTISTQSGISSYWYFISNYMPIP
jgi:hypothetical protein